MRTLLYNSDNYLVIESPAWGRIEVVDKRCRRGAYLEGELADILRSSIAYAACHRSGEAAMDTVLSRYAWLYTNPPTLH